MKSSLRRNELKSFFVGSILGDGSIHEVSNSGKSGYIESHSEKQKEYAEWKIKVMEKHLPTLFKLHPYISTVKGKDYNVVVMVSSYNKYFAKLREIFYTDTKRGGKKHIPKDFCEKHFTALSLAVLFMDDGYIYYPKTSKKGTPHMVEMALCSFTEEDNNFLIDLLYKKFNLKFSMRKTKRGHIMLRLYRKEYIAKFIELIKPYILPTLEYKITPWNLRANSVKEIATPQLADENVF